MKTLALLDANDFAASVESGTGLTLVDFYAEWCGPCKMIAPALEALSQAYEGRVRIVKLDADAHPELLARYGVRGLPTLIMFEDGVPVGTLVGAQPVAALRAFIDRYAVDSASTTALAG